MVITGDAQRRGRTRRGGDRVGSVNGAPSIVVGDDQWNVAPDEAAGSAQTIANTNASSTHRPQPLPCADSKSQTARITTCGRQRGLALNIAASIPPVAASRQPLIAQRRCV